MAAVGMVDAERALRGKIDGYLKRISEAEEIIDQISAERYRQILSLHYLCGMSLRSVSDELGYKDENSIYRAHGWALAEAQKIMNARKTE